MGGQPFPIILFPQPSTLFVLSYEYHTITDSIGLFLEPLVVVHLPIRPNTWLSCSSRSSMSRNSKGYSVRYILPSLRIITLTVGTIIHSKKYLVNPKRTVESQRLHRPQTYKGRFSLSYPINLDNSQMNGVVTTFPK